MLEQLGVSNADAWMKANGGDPVMRTFLWNYMEKMGEDTLLRGKGGPGSRGAGGGNRTPGKEPARDKDGNVVASGSDDFYETMDDKEFDDQSSLS